MTVATPEGPTQVIVDFTTWPTRSEVAAQIGCSVSTVRRWQRDGTLTAHVDAEGTHRYNPIEVKNLRLDKAERAAEDDYEGEAAEAKLAVKLVSGLQDTRKQLDSMLLKTVERQERRIEQLESQLVEAWQGREAGLNQQALREAMVEQTTEQEKRRTMLAEAAIEHVGRFLGKEPPKASFLESLTVEQLEALAETEGAWTDIQERSLRAHLAKKKLLLNQAPETAEKKG